MAELPQKYIDPTLALVELEILHKHKKNEQKNVRGYLDMSSIGDDCSRKLWYQFRFMVNSNFTVETAMNFEDGHRTEDLIASRLRLVSSLKLVTHDANTGGQYRYTDFAGHFSGGLGGFITGLMQAPKTTHVWECKATNEKKFNEFAKARDKFGEKDTLRNWNFTYYGQAQIYMHYAGLARHYLTVGSSGGRAMDSARTEYDKGVAKSLIEKAEQIIFSDDAPTRLSFDASYFKCSWCPAKKVCHEGAMPKVNCRTCLHSTPERTGNATWSCARHKKNLTIKEQIAGCSDHLYLPNLIAHSSPIDSSSESNWVEYKHNASGRVWRNGRSEQGLYSSHEIALDVDGAMLGDEVVDMIKDRLGGTLASVREKKTEVEIAADDALAEQQKIKTYDPTLKKATSKKWGDAVKSKNKGVKS